MLQTLSAIVDFIQAKRVYLRYITTKTNKYYVSCAVAENYSTEFKTKIHSSSDVVVEMCIKLFLKICRLASSLA